MLCLFKELNKGNNKRLKHHLFPESPIGKLWLEVLLLVVDAGQALAVEHAVIPAVVDPGAVLHTLKHTKFITCYTETELCQDQPKGRVGANPGITNDNFACLRLVIKMR